MKRNLSKELILRRFSSNLYPLSVRKKAKKLWEEDNTSKQKEIYLADEVLVVLLREAAVLLTSFVAYTFPVRFYKLKHIY